MTRGDADHAADGTLFLWFCLVFAEVKSADAVEVTLRGGVPMGAPVAEWAEATGIPVSDKSVVFTIMPSTVGHLSALAAALRAIVALAHRATA